MDRFLLLIPNVKLFLHIPGKLNPHSITPRAAPGHRPGHALSPGIRRVTEPHAKIAGLVPSGNDRCRTPARTLVRPKYPPLRTFAVEPFTMAANLHGWTLTVGYNVCMSFEDDESPDINDQQPREAADQFDEDLMRELERRQSSPSR
jgi:hypothetical protein